MAGNGVHIKERPLASNRRVPDEVAALSISLVI